MDIWDYWAMVLHEAFAPTSGLSIGAVVVAVDGVLVAREICGIGDVVFMSLKSGHEFSQFNVGRNGQFQQHARYRKILRMFHLTNVAHCPAGVRLPQFNVLARRSDSMGITGCIRIVAFARVVSPVPSDTANLFIRRDLIE
jgi:hypothetical protein